MPSENNPSAIGIDLGTTYSVIAYVNDAGRPETIPNSEGDLLTPSVVFFDDETVIIGKEAAKASVTNLQDVAVCPKREMGSRLYHKQFGDRKYPPEALQAWILNKLKNDAARTAGNVKKAVITVPAYFDEVRRKATMDAGYMAGLDVQDIINEPTAAAIAYGYQSGWIDEDGLADEPQNVLVYDLGGGTFDVTLMRIRKHVFKTIATDGDMRLGGHDWDQKLIDYVAEKFLSMHGFDPREDDGSLGRLLRDCKEAKETLSVRSKTTIECSLGANSLKVEIPREKFHELTIDLLDRTDFTVRQTLKAAQMSWADVDRVLLVGGSTRMPAVREMLASVSGKEPDTSLSPDEAVSHGAAMRSAMLQGNQNSAVRPAEISNVNSHSLGVVARDVESGRSQVVKLIPRNTPLPVTARRVFKTHRLDQESILVQIVEGESSLPDDCSSIGRCSIWDLPESIPIGTPIEVKFRYAENGRLNIKVKVGSDEERAFRYQLERPNSLTQEQLDSWREYICKS